MQPTTTFPLHDSLGFYQMAEQAPLAMALLIGPQFVVQSANRKQLELWGRTEQEVIGQPLFAIFPELESHDFKDRLTAVYKTGAVHKGEEVPAQFFRNGQLTQAWFDFTYTPLRSDQGDVQGILVVSTEVTNRVLAQQKLEAQQQQFINAVNVIPQLAWVSAPDGTVLFFNNRLQLYWNEAGLRSGAVSWEAAIHPDDLALTLHNWQTALQHGSISEEEHRVKMRDGTYRWHLTRSVPVKNERGEVVNWYGTSTDVHELKQAAQKLQNAVNALSLYETIVTNINEAVLITEAEPVESPDGPRILFVNEAFTRMTGYSAEEVIGKTPRLLQGPKTDRRQLDKIYAALKKWEPVRVELANYRKDGSEFQVELEIVPRADERGWFTHWISVQRDVTQRKKDEEKLRLSEENYRSIVDTTNEGIWQIDKEGRTLLVNRAMSDLLGYGEEEMKGREVTGFCFEEDVAMAAERIASNLQGNYEQFDFRFRKKDGAEVLVLASTNPIHDGSGNVVGALGMFIDITPRKKTEDALQKSNELFRSLAGAAPVGIFRTTAGGDCIYVNQRYSEISGFSVEEAAGQGWTGAIHPDDRAMVFQQWNEAVAQDKPFAGEYRFLNKQGQTVWVVGKAVAEKDTTGKVYGYVGTITDITSRKQAEEALRIASAQQQETLAHLESLLSNAPLGVAFFDRHHRYVRINEFLSEINGIEAGYHIGKTIEEVLPVNAKTVVPVLDHVVQTGEAVTNLEVTGETPKHPGVTRHWLTGFYPVFKTGGTEVEFVGAVVMEISDRKRAEEALRESESRFRTMADTTPAIIWTADPNGKITFHNSQWLDYTGLTPEENASDWARRVLHPDDYERCTKAWGEALERGQFYEVEVRNRRRDGEYRWFLTRAIPVRNQEGNIVSWVGSTTDIHEQKTFAEKLEAEVAERTKELQRSNEDLQQFAHVASHDLKEPVRKVLTFASRLTAEFGEQLPEKARTYVSKIEGAARRSHAMVEGVLTYSSALAQEQSREPVDLNEIFRNIEADLEVAIAEKAATIRCGPLPVLHGSPVLLYQLFYNLVYNALKFSGEKTPLVCIEAEKTVQPVGDCWTISVRDNGIGFPQSEAEHIFQTFSRLHSKDHYEGSGLGLSLCKKIAERHGGRITAEGEPGEGAVFSVTLPA